MEEEAGENYITRTFVIFFTHQISFVLQTKEDELDGTYHA
jgi:hypothetical protein